MAEMPFYLQGSQTGNIMYPQQNVMQGALQGAQGTLLGGQSAIPAVGGAVSGASDFYNQLISRGYTPEQAAPYLNYGITSGASPNGPGVNTYPGMVAGATSGDGSFPIAGQSSGWMSPAELGQATDALNTSGVSGSVGGGGGSGGGTGSGTDAGTGSAIPGLLNNAQLPNSPSPGFSPLQAPNMQPVNYQSPQSQISQFQGQPISPLLPTTQGLPPGQNGTLQMQPASAQNSLNNYYNTPQYQNLNAPGAFQNSPGYQYAVNEALQQVQGNASARGLLESGRVMRDMTSTAQGLAQQDYGNWWNRQNQLYGDYQNRLAGLAGGDTGANNAMATGQALGQGSYNTGANLASLFGGQGNVGLGAFANTGAAQAQSMNQAANTQLGVNSANNSTLLAGAMLNKGQF